MAVDWAFVFKNLGGGGIRARGINASEGKAKTLKVLGTAKKATLATGAPFTRKRGNEKGIACLVIKLVALEVDVKTPKGQEGSERCELGTHYK